MPLKKLYLKVAKLRSKIKQSRFLMKKLGWFIKILKYNEPHNELNREVHEKKCLFYTKTAKVEKCYLLHNNVALPMGRRFGATTNCA